MTSADVAAPSRSKARNAVATATGAGAKLEALMEGFEAAMVRLGYSPPLRLSSGAGYVLRSNQNLFKLYKWSAMTLSARKNSHG